MLMVMRIMMKEGKYPYITMAEFGLTIPYLQKCKVLQRSHKALAELALSAEFSDRTLTSYKPDRITSSNDISMLDSQPYGSLHHGIFTAHQMGGLPWVKMEVWVWSMKDTNITVSKTFSL